MVGQDGREGWTQIRTRDTCLPRGGVGKGWGEGDKKRGTVACGGEGAQRKEQGLGKKGRISPGTIYLAWETGPAGLPATFFTIPTRTQGSTEKRGEWVESAVPWMLFISSFCNAKNGSRH